MDLHVRFSDGTILEIDAKYEKTWKKFNKHRLVIATLVSLFPCLRPAFGETMYSFFSDLDSLEHFVTVSFALVMVHKRYGFCPPEFMDLWYPCFGMTTFDVWLSDGTPDPFIEGDITEVQRLDITPESVREFMQLVTGLQTVTAYEANNTESSVPVDDEVDDHSMFISGHQYEYGYVYAQPPCEVVDNCRMCSYFASTHGRPRQTCPWNIVQGCNRLVPRGLFYISLFSEAKRRDKILVHGTRFVLRKNRVPPDCSQSKDTPPKRTRISRSLLRSCSIN